MKEVLKRAGEDFIEAPLQTSAVLMCYGAAFIAIWHSDVDRSLLYLILGMMWNRDRAQYIKDVKNERS